MSGVEKCPYCRKKFSTDQGSYHPSGRIECPKCGSEFDAEHDEDYNAEMDRQDSGESEYKCDTCGTGMNYASYGARAWGKDWCKDCLSAEDECRKTGSMSEADHDMAVGCEMCGSADEPLLDMEDHGMLCAACAEEAEQQEREEELERQRDYHADMKMDMRRHGEAMSFDRFMDRILITEGSKKVEAPTMTPQRIRAARNQERPLNRIRYNGGK